MLRMTWLYLYGSYPSPDRAAWRADTIFLANLEFMALDLDDKREIAPTGTGNSTVRVLNGTAGGLWASINETRQVGYGGGGS
jgi:hypothetical protein